MPDRPDTEEQASKGDKASSGSFGESNAADPQEAGRKGAEAQPTEAAVDPHPHASARTGSPGRCTANVVIDSNWIGYHPNIRFLVEQPASPGLSAALLVNSGTTVLSPRDPCGCQTPAERGTIP
ncbi:hypothetical protein [Nocardia pseudobrasiliensis]|uniref:Uncharacterized protein n=1 Tax=Nocardia pseudobrasiliensis TaxID=45979 RepID=A0A370HW50_9NOCA|nr:hypothetical protein [Nocardia pseudobrasiliensis]RDI62729.1 hypothetical protein DFR76_11246 [Nocardia pseudobrasiliensis]